MGIALLAAVVYLANPVQLWGRLQQASPWWLLGGFGISIASNVVSAWRWRAMARWRGRDVAGLRHALVLSGHRPECAAAWRCRGR
jgi:uncharacterized membrane protein